MNEDFSNVKTVRVLRATQREHDAVRVLKCVVTTFQLCLSEPYVQVVFLGLEESQQVSTSLKLDRFELALPRERRGNALLIHNSFLILTPLGIQFLSRLCTRS